MRARMYVDGRYQGRGDTTRTLRADRHGVHVEAGRLIRARLDLNG